MLSTELAAIGILGLLIAVVAVLALVRGRGKLSGVLQAPGFGAKIDASSGAPPPGAHVERVKGRNVTAFDGSGRSATVKDADASGDVQAHVGEGGKA
ncbi:MAG: hypothetical protein M9894_00580 [Planctomycetes bacterium]|nr:hypothetical protein [Planctomycetota bacterium]